MASIGRPAAQDAFKALMALGFHKPGDVEKSSRILREPNPSLRPVTSTINKPGNPRKE